MIQKLSSDFAAEIKTKQDALNVTSAHLRTATRELADQRRQISVWQAKCGEFDQVNQRIRNLEKAAVEEEKFDWTGRTQQDGAGGSKPNPAFTPRKRLDGSVTTDDVTSEISGSIKARESSIPTENSLENLVRLRRMKMHQDRMAQLLDTRLKSLQGASAEKEFMCKKIIALCTGITIDKVEDVSSLLFLFVLNRISSFHYGNTGKMKGIIADDCVV